MIEMGQRKKYAGYVTDIITDRCTTTGSRRTLEQPFCLMFHHGRAPALGSRARTI